MNIAILVGISKYRLADPLPACEFDVESMRKLLVATRKYDDIQLIHEHTNAAEVKDALRTFFSKHQSAASIDEAFVYFSGHGFYQNDAMLCCSDFEASRPATTSIANNEIDDLLRSVKPKVAVKIIDACQSGAPYIKDATAGFEKALRNTRLESFICMASSRQNQSSYASATESYFTTKWIEAVLANQQNSILYRDIQAALADSFVLNPDQTPFFVNQGTGLEMFAAVTDDLRSLSAARAKTAPLEKHDGAIVSLIESEVAKRDEAFVPHTDVLEAVEKARNLLVAHQIADGVVSKFYKASIKTDVKMTAVPKGRAVAEFAQEQAWSKRYFARINLEQYQVRVHKNPLARLEFFYPTSKIFGLEDDNNYVSETRSRPGSLEVTEALPFEVAELTYESSRPSLPVFQIYVGLVHSLTEVMVLSTTLRLTQKGWSTKAPELSEVQWRYQTYPWTTVVKSPLSLWKDAIQRGETDIRTFLEGLMPKAEPVVSEPPALEQKSEQP